jgi:glycosyltransferase involved in cell wall biosynthesis
LSPLEAALCGCAIVAREIASMREVWANAALYFRDAEDLSVVLRQLFEDPELLRRYQQRAVERARMFSRERMVESYRTVYSNVLNKERACVA